MNTKKNAEAATRRERIVALVGESPRTARELGAVIPEISLGTMQKELRMLVLHAQLRSEMVRTENAPKGECVYYSTESAQQVKAKVAAMQSSRVMGDVIVDTLRETPQT